MSFMYFLIHAFIHSVSTYLVGTVQGPSAFVTQLGAEARVCHSWCSMVSPMKHIKPACPLHMTYTYLEHLLIVY